MIYQMMSSIPTYLIVAVLIGAFLLLVGGVSFVLLEFRRMNRNPEKYVPCPDTLPCLDRDPQQLRMQRG